MKTVKHEMDRLIETLAEKSALLVTRLETFFNARGGKKRLYIASAKLEELFLYAEGMARDAKELQGANRLFYANRGKASPKKAAASKENGKFGGRPPKEITEAKRRVEELEALAAPTKKQKRELYELNLKIAAWRKSKKNRPNA